MSNQTQHLIFSVDFNNRMLVPNVINYLKETITEAIQYQQRTIKYAPRGEECSDLLISVLRWGHVFDILYCAINQKTALDNFITYITEIWDKKKPMSDSCLGTTYLNLAVWDTLRNVRENHRTTTHFITDNKKLVYALEYPKDREPERAYAMYNKNAIYIDSNNSKQYRSGPAPCGFRSNNPLYGKLQRLREEHIPYPDTPHNLYPFFKSTENTMSITKEPYVIVNTKDTKGNTYKNQIIYEVPLIGGAQDRIIVRQHKNKISIKYRALVRRKNAFIAQSLTPDFEKDLMYEKFINNRLVESISAVYSEGLLIVIIKFHDENKDAKIITVKQG